MNNDENAPAAVSAETVDAPENKGKEKKNCCAVKTVVIALLTAVIAIAVYHCLITWKNCAGEEEACPPKPRQVLHIYHHFDESPEAPAGKPGHHAPKHQFNGERKFNRDRKPGAPRDSRIRRNRKDNPQRPTQVQVD